ncbi:hypothetical protein NRE35_004354 [Salmonella enterica]|nr:hypothetical protein [Escherichia coli]EJO2543988.1 hypothetical protein [Salmonella enterica]ELF5187209.1 hypothetical protein [Salmonella enterica]
MVEIQNTRFTNPGSDVINIYSNLGLGYHHAFRAKDLRGHSIDGGELRIVTEYTDIVIKIGTWDKRECQAIDRILTQLVVDPREETVVKLISIQ